MSQTIADILTLERTQMGAHCTSKKRLIEHVATFLADQFEDTQADDIYEKLIAREKLGSTGIGNGIAIPHGRIKQSDKPVAVLLVTTQGVNYDAIDKRPVDIFCALLVPEDQCDTHLATLASIAKTFDNKEILRKIRNAQSDQDLFNIIEAA